MQHAKMLMEGIYLVFKKKIAFSIFIELLFSSAKEMASSFDISLDCCAAIGYPRNSINAMI